MEKQITMSKECELLITQFNTYNNFSNCMDLKNIVDMGTMTGLRMATVGTNALYEFFKNDGEEWCSAIVEVNKICNNKEYEQFIFTNAFYSMALIFLVEKSNKPWYYNINKIVFCDIDENEVVTIFDSKVGFITK